MADREPLLSPENINHSDRGSSYDSIPSEEDQGLEGKEAEIHSESTRLCAICFDSPRDCFFLPCGHCAACFSCGSRKVLFNSLMLYITLDFFAKYCSQKIKSCRIAEESGTCPICRRKMKRVRKIIAV